MPKWLHICGQNKQPARSRFEKVKQANMAQKYTQKETQYNETKEPKAKPRRELKIQFGNSLGINFVLAFIGRKLIPRNMMHT